jgi:hypothetical protein
MPGSIGPRVQCQFMILGSLGMLGLNDAAECANVPFRHTPAGQK